MCDYSLEMYASRPARENEKYVTTRFPTGSIGLATAQDPRTAVCVMCDTPLALDKISPQIQAQLGIGESEKAVFAQIKYGGYRDGVRFDNGNEISLQQLGPGIEVSVGPLLERAEPFRTGENVEMEQNQREAVSVRESAFGALTAAASAAFRFV